MRADRHGICLTNESHYNTKDLKKLTKLVLEHEGMIPYESWYEVLFDTSRTWYTTGWGYYHRRNFRIGLPNPKRNGKKDLSNGKVKRIARVMIHEIGHNRGLRHKEMVPSYTIDVDFIPDDFIIRLDTQKKNGTPRKKKKNTREYVATCKECGKVLRFSRMTQKKIKLIYNSEHHIRYRCSSTKCSGEFGVLNRWK